MYGDMQVSSAYAPMWKSSKKAETAVTLILRNVFKGEITDCIRLLILLPPIGYEEFRLHRIFLGAG